MFKLQLLKKHILKVLVTVFFLFNILLLKSQNLVPNPSFEECYSMPTHFLLINNIHKIIKRWNCPVSATPDYFNSRAYRTVSVPNNFIGSQEAKTGNAYVGLILMYANGSEYLQARLKSPLKKDSIYCLSLYISLAEKSSHFVDQVGMYFTDKKIEKVGWQILNYKPVLNNKRGNILKNTEDWTLISGLYKAKGNEKFILIGNFSCSDSSNYHETKARILFQPFRMNAYYYIDDVSVVPYSLKNKTVCTVEDYMNSFSKSNYYKLEFNKKIILKNLFFDVDKFIIKPNGYKTLQPLLLFLKYETNTKIEIIGHTDNSGTEEHNRKLSRNRAQSVAKYLIDNGIDKKHIYYNGVGSTEPISSNSTEKGKSKNRRVEIRLFK